MQAGSACTGRSPRSKSRYAKAGACGATGYAGFLAHYDIVVLCASGGRIDHVGLPSTRCCSRDEASRSGTTKAPAGGGHACSHEPRCFRGGQRDDSVPTAAEDLSDAREAGVVRHTNLI
jgi:hypothetical protein